MIVGENGASFQSTFERTSRCISISLTMRSIECSVCEWHVELLDGADRVRCFSRRRTPVIKIGTDAHVKTAALDVDVLGKIGIRHVRPVARARFASAVRPSDTCTSTCRGLQSGAAAQADSGGLLMAKVPGLRQRRCQPLAPSKWPSGYVCERGEFFNSLLGGRRADFAPKIQPEPLGRQEKRATQTPEHRFWPVAGPHSAIDGLANDSRTSSCCLLYTSDAADDLLCVDLGGRRIIK